jgi:hypothetical protein
MTTAELPYTTAEMAGYVRQAADWFVACPADSQPPYTPIYDAADRLEALQAKNERLKEQRGRDANLVIALNSANVDLKFERDCARSDLQVEREAHAKTRDEVMALSDELAERSGALADAKTALAAERLASIGVVEGLRKWLMREIRNNNHNVVYNRGYSHAAKSTLAKLAEAQGDAEACRQAATGHQWALLAEREAHAATRATQALMADEIERLTLAAECDRRDPAHINCRNATAQVEAQRDRAEADAARLRDEVKTWTGLSDHYRVQAESFRATAVEQQARAIDFRTDRDRLRGVVGGLRVWLDECGGSDDRAPEWAVLTKLAELDAQPVPSPKESE